MIPRRVGAGVLLGALLGALLGGGPLTQPAPASAADEACTPGNVVFAPERPSGLDLLQADAAWQRSTGEGVVVAVVDSGIDVDNPHLTAAVIGGINLVGDGERADGLSDPHGHGTAIAGQIAAQPVAGSGVVGLAPDARLLSVRVFRGTDEEAVRSGFGPTTERLAAGIRYAATHGADIINVSLSDYDDSDELRAAVDAAATVGSLVVASAGNRATTGQTADGPRYPAGYSGSIGVTASNAVGTVTDDSIHGPQVDVAAPGADVLTAATGAGDCVYGADAPSSSFATAYVSGAAALVAAAHPDEGPDGWSYRLMASAARVDPDRRDDVNGWGLIQPANAIDLLPDSTTRGPASPFFDTAGSAVRMTAAPVAESTESEPFAPTALATALVAIVGAALLATIGAVALLRRRRREDPAAATVTPPRRGMLDPPEPLE